MDAASLGILSVNVVMAGISLFAAEATKECARPAVRFVIERFTARIRGVLGAANVPEGEIDAEMLSDKRILGDHEAVKLTGELIECYSSVRRARVVADFLAGAKILWVDDHPGNNFNEKRMLEGFGIHVDQVRSTAEALNRLLGRSFDLVLSDIHRDDRSDAGMELLARLRGSECPAPVVFYVGQMNDTQGVPVGAFGIADQPEPLLHLVLDVLERRRI